MTDQEDEGDDVVFELGEWGDEFRAAVGKVLGERGIGHDWEGTDLVVDEEDADLVDAILDQLEAEPLDEVIPLDESDTEPAENEATYEDVSALFVAADRLAHAPDDVALAEDADEAAASVDGTSAPFGVADREWARILAAADALIDTIEGGDPDAIATSARTVRDLLRVYV